MFGMHTWLGIRAEWTVTSYVTFALQLLIGFGLVFELPTILLALGKLGIGQLTPAPIDASTRDRHYPDRRGRSNTARRVFPVADGSAVGRTLRDLYLAGVDG